MGVILASGDRVLRVPYAFKQYCTRPLIIGAAWLIAG